MLTEIGSEFWDEQFEGLNQSGPLLPGSKEKAYLLSGRTALDFIIRDAKNEGRLTNVALPSYCCHTMIEPFVRNGVGVTFYDVVYKPNTGLSAKIQATHECDAVYIMDYFGFRGNQPVEIDDEPFGNKLLIYDATHSIFSQEPFPNIADYVYASFRKWMFVPGVALAIKRGSLTLSQPEVTKPDYVMLRRRAASEKANYILHKEGTKEYLGTFKQAEELLEADYVSYAADIISLQKLRNLDVTLLRARRRNNALLLLEGLEGNPVIEPIFNAISDSDCPLFVPVVVRDGWRDNLREHLIKENIYCPIHWPLSAMHKISEEARKLYGMELSLICDQRYGFSDMQHIISIINKFTASIV